MSGDDRKKVIFICTHNSARSQMAEGILKNLYGDRFEVYSAGTEPSRVNPYAIRAMEEIGVDISGHSSKAIEKFLGKEFDYVITLCGEAGEVCPAFPGGDINRLHRGFPDPSQFRGKDEEILAGFRTVRDEIRTWLESEFERN